MSTGGKPIAPALRSQIRPIKRFWRNRADLNRVAHLLARTMRSLAIEIAVAPRTVIASIGLRSIACAWPKSGLRASETVDAGRR